MNEKERFQRLLKVLADLAEENESSPIVVEGRRDFDALHALGCLGEIVIFHSGGTMVEFCELLGRRSKRAILLMDWDRKGRSLQDDLSQGLALAGVEVNGTFRDLLKRWANAQVKDIESLAPYVERGRRKFKL